MKKMFTLFLITMFSLPAFASCPVDTDKPCTGNNIDNLNLSKSVLNEYPQEKTSQNNSANQNYIDIQSYDPDCQFGVCLPEKTEDINMPEK